MVICSGPTKYTAQAIGQIVRENRKRLGVTQKDLALTSGTGLRFVIDLEKGKGNLPDRQGSDGPANAGKPDRADAAGGFKECLFSRTGERFRVRAVFKACDTGPFPSL